MAKKSEARFARYRFAGADSDRSAKPAARAATPKPFDLAAVDPAAKPFSSGDKIADRAAADALATAIDRLQDVLWADRRHSLLVVLQGLDTSGKDGTVRGVFGKTSALGVRAVSYKAPTEEEKAHDFLWRVHKNTPGAGELTIFNRSHYEDVLVPVVLRQIDVRETARRYAQINAFERLLVENGTLVLKFFLHISKDEQKERLQARLDDPTKHWKFEAGDLAVRKQWDAYQRAYAAAIGATGTREAPWTIVPANSKTHRDLMIGTAVVEALEGLKLAYPPGDPKLDRVRVK